MTYEYKCIKCGKSFDVVKPVKDMDINEYCPSCDSPAERMFVPRNVFFNGAKVEHAEYNPGLGCVVKNKAHKQDIMKRKGLSEVGNDFKSGEKMQAHFDKAREEKLNKRYEDI